MSDSAQSERNPPRNRGENLALIVVIQLIAFVVTLLIGLAIGLAIAFGPAVFQRLKAHEGPRRLATTEEPSRSTSPADTPRFPAYELSLRGAAIKQPDQLVPLATISSTATAVDVVTFTSSPAPPTDKRTFDIWISLPSQLKAACAGATDPVRRIQEILGLPPVAAPNGVIRQYSVAPDGLYRPCINGASVSTNQCGFDIPPPPDPTDPTAVAKAYDQMRFVYNQMVTSYRTGFIVPGRQPTDYPYSGYPFTGMGWTYDWGANPTHVGVSEFVIRRDAQLALGPVLTPAEFCATSK